MKLTEAQMRVVLESLKAHAEEGWYLLGHYDKLGRPLAETRANPIELGRQLCDELDIPLEGRNWLSDDEAQRLAKP